MQFIPFFIFVSLLGLVSLNRAEAAGTAESGSAQSLDVQGALSQMEKALNQQQEAEEGITPEDEYYLGRAVAANILDFYKPYQQNQALTKYLNKICAALVLNSQQPLIFNGYHLMILDSTEFNGFATSGGHIFLTRGLINLAPSEDTLAAVIAHEIAHIQLRHGVQLIENMRTVQRLSEIADNASRIAGQGSALEERTSLFRDSVKEMANSMMEKGYSQTQEFEADTLALSILSKAGYNPSSLVELLKILKENQGDHPGGFGTTHPDPQVRIANLTRIMKDYPDPNTQSFRQPRFSSIKK